MWTTADPARNGQHAATGKPRQASIARPNATPPIPIAPTRVNRSVPPLSTAFHAAWIAAESNAAPIASGGKQCPDACAADRVHGRFRTKGSERRRNSPNLTLPEPVSTLPRLRAVPDRRAPAQVAELVDALVSGTSG